MRKKSLISTAIAVLISASIFAQASKQRHARNELHQFKSELNLTSEQEQAIQKINEEYKVKLKALRDADMETSDRRTQLIALREAHQANLSDVLTEEQKTQLTELREEAQQTRKDRAASIDKEGLRKELKTYRENTIQPTLQTQRAKLETKISTEDKEAIEKLRADFHSVGKRMKERRQKGEKRHFKGFTEEEKAKHEQLGSLIEKYDSDINNLMEEIEPQTKQWREETREIYSKYMPERPQRSEDRQRRMKRAEGERGQKGKMKGRRAEMRSFISKGHFLLLDPNSDNTNNLEVISLNEMRSYPNPAVGINTLQYTIKQAGQIRIELRDRQGQVLKVLVDDFQDLGSYNMDVDISQLKTGVYYYTIIDGQGQRTERLVITK